MDVTCGTDGRIRESLRAIGRGQDCIIALAVESGSRAWGFESADSDFDVRFIYVRRPGWYLSIDVEHRRGVIEMPISDDLDISGWDLRKALKLLRRSNPPLLEWLQSPIVYREWPDITEGLRRLTFEFHSPRAAHFHYLHMAQNTARAYLRGDTVSRKKYFYALRPILAMRWIEEGRGLVPIEFAKLVEATVTDAALRQAIDALLVAKRAGVEMDAGPHDPAILPFIEAELERFDCSGKTLPVAHGDSAELDRFFRWALGAVWGGCGG